MEHLALELTARIFYDDQLWHAKHTEGLVQEIGRALRNGENAQVILCHKISGNYSQCVCQEIWEKP